MSHLDYKENTDQTSVETNDETDKTTQIKKTLKAIKKHLNKSTTNDETSNISNLADDIYQEKYLKAQKDLKLGNDELIPKEELYSQEFEIDEEAHNQDIKQIVISLGKSLSKYHYKNTDNEELEEDNVKEIVNNNTSQVVVDHVIKKLNKLDVHY